MTKAQSTKHKAQKNGFTLVEVLVAIGLFALLVVGIIGVLLQASRAYLRASNRQTQVDNIRFGLDLLAREMRTGIEFSTPSYCSSVAPGIEFTNLTANQRRFYFLFDTDGDTLGDTVKRIAKSNTDPITPADCDNAAVFMGGGSGEGIKVTYLIFTPRGIVTGWSDGQPWITINLVTQVPDPYGGFLTSFIQTTITPRIRDF